MRFKLTLTKTPAANRLPINYQYELSAWIYRVLEEASPEFSAFLHGQGYTYGSKQFKLFTYSSLEVARYSIDKTTERLIILSDTVSLQISFCLEEAASTFITGLFMNQRLGLGDRLSRVDFVVSGVEALPEPEFTEHMQLQTLSPLCLSVAEERHGRIMPQYLSPEDSRFEKLFFDNLLHKFMALPQFALAAAEDADALQGDLFMQFRLLSAPKARLITIKKDTPQETKVRGYLFDFALQAPANLIEFGYAAGFGEKNSMGFGCVGVRESKVI
jgi:CRISPR-associated endoribonuclease Cas6